MKLPTFIRRWFIQPPADIVKAFNDVNSSMTYVYYKSDAYRDSDKSWYVLELRPKWAKPGQGNCVAFAKAYKKALSRGTFEMFKLWNGDWHCVLDVEDGDNTWRLDCRKRMVELV